MRRLSAAAACCALAAGALGAPSPAEAAPRVIVAFLPTEPAPGLPLLFDLARRPGLAIGLTSPTLGGYNVRQMALDMSQGARIGTRAYRTPLEGPYLTLEGRGGRIAHWKGVLERAAAASGTLRPGLLAEAVRRSGRRVAYAGVVGFEQAEAIVAADGRGRIARVSLGTSGTLAERARALWLESDLLVARLPPDAPGLAALDRLLAARGHEDLVYVVRAPPGDEFFLLPTGMAGRGYGGTLFSETTRRPGIIAATDVAPTVLERIGVPVPPEMQGRPIESRPGGGPEPVRALSARLDVVVSRRGPALGYLLLGWLVLGGGLTLARRADGARAAFRIGLLSALWLPAAALAAAALAPPSMIETLGLAGGSLALGALTDRLSPWPAGPAVPAAVVMVTHAIDLASGSALVAGSLAGPNPKGGARFYGVGNELEAILSVSVLVGTGAALSWRGGRHAPLAFAATALGAATIIGAGRLGADVGGVITLAAGAAAAVIVSRGRRPSRRSLVAAAAVPAVALGALVALDLATAGGAHLTRSVLEGGSSDELLGILGRRLEASVSTLARGAMPFTAGAAAIALVLGVWRRRELFDFLDGAGAASLRAGIAGAAWATVVGALANDSGPQFLVLGTVCLVLATAYARARPRAGGEERGSQGAAGPARMAVGTRPEGRPGVV